MKWAGLAAVCTLLIGCTAGKQTVVVTATLPPALPATPPQAATATVTLAPVTCGDLDATWGDWPKAIATLNQLIAQEMTCGDEPLTSKLYAAHYNFAVDLESDGNIEQAIQHYHDALKTAPRREDALKALARLNSLPTATPWPCAPIDPNTALPETSESLDSDRVVRAEGERLMLGSEPFRVRGVNYYPRHASWDRFLIQADSKEMRQELDLIHDAGFNTIRIFLWFQPLFGCLSGETIPNEAAFSKVDRLLRLAEKRDLKVIVTLNDLPDLYIKPLYAGNPYAEAQAAYIVQRYKSSPAILAWDIRNEGDLDYLPRHDTPPRFTSEQVLTWLGTASEAIRRVDPDHLITAGWWGDPTETAPYVDLLSFHHWDTADLMKARIADYRQKSGKPIFLEEFGYPIRGTDDQVEAQTRLGDVARAADEQGLAGWLVWTAFDFQPAPGQQANYEHFFGLWTLDLQPKAGLRALPLLAN